MLSLLFAATMAQAANLNILCTITEGGDTKKTTTIEHVISGDTHGAITNFETAYTTGFVANQKGYTVVNYVLKSNGQVVSFFGDFLHGRAVGGVFYTDGQLKNWVQTECVIK